MFQLLSLKFVPVTAFVLLCSIFGSVPASATRAECEKALLAVQAILGEGPKTEMYDDEGRRQTEPTVTVIRNFKGKHGGRRLILEKVGASWLSNYATVSYDPQGDPRWFIEVMGTEAAEFFGFKILSDYTVQVPDGKEFNGALKKINRYLKSIGKEQIEIGFYVTADNENTKVGEYVRDFGFASLLPLALNGNHLIHDLSFHTGAIFLPGHLIRLASYFARFLDGYIGFLSERYADHPAKLAAVKHFAFLLRINQTVLIDTGTGTVNPGIVASLRKPGSHDALEMLFAPMALLSGSGKNARDYFEGKILALEPRALKHIAEYDGYSDPKRTVQAAADLSLAEMLSALDDFNKPEHMPGADTFGRTFVPPTQEVMESLCRGIQLRRLVIRDAALFLLAEGREEVR